MFCCFAMLATKLPAPSDAVGPARTEFTVTPVPATDSQTNGIVERLHKTVLDEFYRIAFRKRLYASIGDLQDDLDLWVKSYNEERPHQGA
jgi:hypothetical protein